MMVCSRLAAAATVQVVSGRPFWPEELVSSKKAKLEREYQGSKYVHVHYASSLTTAANFSKTAVAVLQGLWETAERLRTPGVAFAA